ncbi:MAG: hypothetical protein KDI73_02070 [Candidatus Competibacteraceae bacterium]|nr:hypothetical protein [Candidatus Competibacteraceae bacterium]
MLTLALNTPLPLPASASAAPTWIQLLPDATDITGYDGRRWRNDLPDRVVAQSRMPLVLDYEHASEHRAPQGLDAPAAGWITRLEVRGGAAVWGQVDWTERARQQIEAREYRFLSPVFQYEKDSQRIVRLTSAGLTNQPNLSLTALNREGTPTMSLFPAVAEEFTIPVKLNKEDQAFIDETLKHLGINLKQAYERLLQKKAAEKAAKRQLNESFADAFAKGLEQVKEVYWPPADRSAANRATASADPDPLARFAPQHRAQIERYRADNPHLSIEQDVERFLITQRAQSALALSREKGLSYGQAWQQLEPAAFYAAD